MANPATEANLTNPTDTTRPSDAILTPLNLTLGGGWDLGDIQHVLIALLQRLDAPPAATGKPSGSILGPLNLTLDGTWDSGAPARVLRAMLRERDEQHAAGPGEWSMVKEGSHVAVGIASPLSENFRPTGGPRPYKCNHRAIGLGCPECEALSRVEGERCQKCGAFAACVDAGLGGSDTERWCVDCAMRSVCATVSRVEGAAEAKPSAWKQCVTCGACYPASSVCSNCVPVAEPPSPVAGEPDDAERAWEQLNVAGFPGLEDVNGLRNARWGFVAGYLAAAQTIRSALTSAAQEDAAWREIEAWSTEKTNRAFKLEISASGIVQKFRVGSTTYELDEDAGTLLAAIVAAGEWCRAERSKAG